MQLLVILRTRFIREMHAKTCISCASQQQSPPVAAPVAPPPIVVPEPVPEPEPIAVAEPPVQQYYEPPPQQQVHNLPVPSARLL